MRRLIFALLLLFSFSSRADLLERFHIETSLQERLQDIMRIYDSSARVLVHIDYHNYEGALPGTSVGSDERVSPDHIESVDIEKITVDVYTTLDTVPDEAQKNLRTLLPVTDKKRIDLKLHKYDDSHVNSVTPKPVEVKPIEIKDFADTIRGTIDHLAILFAVIFGGGLIVVAGFSLVMNSRRTRDRQEQLKLLVNAIGESGGGRAAPAAQARASAAVDTKPAAAVGEHLFENWPVKSLRELMADAYWCELDGYANWLWREFSSTQKYELLNSLPFLKDYSAYFVDGPVTPNNFHEHPYYLEPQLLAEMSQAELASAVKKEIGLWHAISPMRKQHLPFSLQEKMAAAQAPAPKFSKIQTAKSPTRALQPKPTWGDLSIADESLLYAQPDMVPIEMRKHIRTLVWLAGQNAERVRRVLSKYDARSLASAWVGPEDVLKTLESYLPEKKLKLLHAYRAKMEATRNSEIYQMLVDEGLANEAA